MDRVGIAILNEIPNGLPRLEGRLTHCAMVAKARGGAAFYAEDTNYFCGFAIYTLGLGRNVAAFRKALAEDLVSIKNAAREEISGKILASAPRLPEGQKFIAFFPLDKMPVEPDVVINIGTPAEIMELVRTITSETGEPLQPTIGAVGAMCGEMTVRPIVTGEPNLSLGCCGSRRFGQLGNNEIMLSLPWKRYKRFLHP